MHIVNIICNSAIPEIEQAFANYCEGLHQRGHRITAITHPGSVVNAQLSVLGIQTIPMRNLGEWDIFAVKRLRQRLQEIKPDIVLAHTHRSYMLASKATEGLYPLVVTAYQYNGRENRVLAADGVFATTHKLMESLVRLGMPEDRVFHIPTMVRCHELPIRDARSRYSPPVIGAMGNFVRNKGFDIYLDALALLKQRNYGFKAILGGVGPDTRHIKDYTHKLELQNSLSFPGWIADKRAFFTSLDIFCLPSLHEPFGIAVLEAFVYGVPVISSDGEGPHDITTPNFDALVVPVGNAEEMANAMVKLLDDVQLSYNLAANAFAKAKMIYSIESVAMRVEKALEAVLARVRNERQGIAPTAKAS